MTSWFKKNFLLLLFGACIYLAYFFTHLPSFSHTQVLGVTTNLTLFEEPQDGRDFLVSSLNNARQEIDMEMYLLTDKQIIASLESARSRGVVVKVLLEQSPYAAGSINTKTEVELENKGIDVEWTNPAFSLTHEKAIVIDNQEVFILSQNLSAASFTKNREYDIVDTNSLLT